VVRRNVTFIFHGWGPIEIEDGHTMLAAPSEEDETLVHATFVFRGDRPYAVLFGGVEQAFETIPPLASRASEISAGRVVELLEFGQGSNCARPRRRFFCAPADWTSLVPSTKKTGRAPRLAGIEGVAQRFRSHSRLGLTDTIE
jgi:hypothetical protein